MKVLIRETEKRNYVDVIMTKKELRRVLRKGVGYFCYQVSGKYTVSLGVDG